MKTQKITRTFPDVEPKGLNAEIFRSKIYNAVKDYLRVLKKEKVPYTPKTIYRPQKDEMLIVKLDFPFYDNWDHKWAETTLKEKGIAEFFQYVWERGELRRTLTGPDPQRKEWELFVLRDVIHSPLSSSLNSESIERYIDSGEIEHYHISDIVFFT